MKRLLFILLAATLAGLYGYTAATTLQASFTKQGQTALPFVTTPISASYYVYSWCLLSVASVCHLCNSL